MTGKLVLLAAVFLEGCAEPKYLDANPNRPAQKVELAKASFANSGPIWLSWEKWPTDNEFGSFFLKTGRENKGDQSPVPQDIEGELTIELWMPSMGHGSSPVIVTKVDVGTYRVDRVFFSMSGDWEIRIQRVVNGAMVDKAVFALRF